MTTPPVTRRGLYRAAGLLGLLLALLTAPLQASVDDPLSFDDMPLDDLLKYPDWFKSSFLALDEDLQEAVASGKQGIVVYFGQKRCA